MAHAAGTGTLQAYLVEHYRPGLDVNQLTRAIARIREAVVAMEHAGEPVHYVCSTLVPNDESFLCVIEAANEAVVRDAYDRAGAPFERISPASSVQG